MGLLITWQFKVSSKPENGKHFEKDQKVKHKEPQT